MSDTSDFEEEEVSEMEKRFYRATQCLQKFASELDQKILLTFYGLYKQATVGKCNIPKPGIFNLQGKAKWNAWYELNDMDKDDAMSRYVDEMDKLKPGWDDENKKRTKEQWVSVSTFQMDGEDALEAGDKSQFDYVKEGDLEKLSKIQGLDQLINQVDDNGLGLIHWASDRGNIEILQFLLNNGVDVNLVDPDGQSALHYASSCGHLDCVKLLIKFGADRTIKDKESQSCVDVAENRCVAELLRS